MVALSVPNAASGSLENKDSFLPFFSRILAPNTWCRHGFSQSNSGPKRASHGHTFDAKRCFWILREQDSFLPFFSRTPDPATAFPNLILVENEPPLVALSVPNAPSESLEKNISFISCANSGSEHLTPPRLFLI